MKRFLKTLVSAVGMAFVLFSGAFTIFSLSRSLGQGEFADSLFPEAVAGFGTANLSIFTDYASWPNSTTLDTNDTIAQVLSLGGGTISPLNFVDFNGDGLIDVIYVNNNSSFNRSAVFLNNGSGNFDLLYKCHYNVSTTRYYGDCAQ